VEVLEFVKSCFDDEAVVVKEVGGWRAGWEERVRRVVEASHAEKGDGVVRSDIFVILTLRKGGANGYVLDSFCGVR